MKEEILFISYSLRKSIGFNFGFELLCKIIEENNIKVHKEYLYNVEISNFFNIKKILQTNKNITKIFISFINNNIKEFKYFGNELKKFNLPIIVGGACMLYDWKYFIEENWVDCVCVGDGELPVMQLIENKNHQEIPNLVWKKDDKIIENDLVWYQKDLDSVPDYICKEYMWTSRGCHFTCNHCHHSKKRELYKEKYGCDQYYRQISYDELLKRCITRKSLGLELIDFFDDQLIKNTDEFIDFLRKYKKEVDIPFTCISNPLYLNDDIIKELGKANCKSVTVGFETSDENIRWNILNKRIKNKKYDEIIESVKSNNILMYMSNMLGLPTQKLDNCLDTLKYNAEREIDGIFIYVYYPSSGTKLYDMCLENNWVDSSFIGDSWDNYYTKLINQDFSVDSLFYVKIFSTFYLNYYLTNNEFYLDEIERLKQKYPKKELIDITFKYNYNIDHNNYYSILTSHNNYSELFKKRQING